MEELVSYRDMGEILEELRRYRENINWYRSEKFPIEAVRIGRKIAFVNWAQAMLETLPIFDEVDRVFTSYDDSICVRQGYKWGVLNASFRYELPIEYSYLVANQVCNEIGKQRPRNIDADEDRVQIRMC
jgi:hypothetical protein